MSMKTRIGVKFIAILLVFILFVNLHGMQKTEPQPSTFLALSTSDTEAAEIHKGVWAMAVTRAGTDPYYRYSFYASRVLAVYHPEVYLRADRMFVRAVDKVPLTQKVIKGYIKRTETRVFNLDEIDLSGYQPLSLEEFYEGLFIHPFLDRRALSLSSALRQFDPVEERIVDQDRITQLNKALLYYTVSKNVSDAPLYLIYCDNENTYISCDGTIIWAETLEEAPIIGNPVLIFNEESVWYPLMGRDDTGKDPLLKDVVANVSTSIQTPALNPFEESLIKNLIQITKLDGEDQVAMATLSALKASVYYGVEEYTTNEEVARIWMQVFPGMDTSAFFTIIPAPYGGVDSAILTEIIRRGNYLSPFTAHLASSGGEVGAASMRALSTHYYDMGFRWCCLWTPGMQSLTIDEAFYTHSGTSPVHAYALASILDVAGIDNYVLHGYDLGESTHQINYVPVYDVVFSDGNLYDDHETILYCPDTLSFLSYAEKWAFIVKNRYVGTLSPHESEEYLSFLKKQHQDDIKGLSSVDHRIVGISYEELIKFLETEQEKWIPVEIPMSAVPLPPRPGELDITTLAITPETAQPGEPVTITVDVTNTGKETLTTCITLEINGVTEARKYVTLRSGELKTVSFTVVKDIGKYYVEIEGLKNDYRVKVPEEGIPTMYAVVLVLFVLIVVAYSLNRLMKKLRLVRIVVRKALGGIVTLILVMSMLFILLNAVPGGDPVDRMFPWAGQAKESIRQYWGLDEPLQYQYVIYMKRVFTLNFAPFEGMPHDAFDVIFYLLPFTLLLFGTATLLSYILGTLMGITLLTGKKSRWRSSVVLVFIGFYVFPSFVMAIFFKSWLVFKYYVFPPVSIAVIEDNVWSLYYTLFQQPLSYTEMIRILLPEMVLPLIVLVLVGIARPLLLMRDHMALTLGEPHVMTARAKGLKERTIRFRHVARCALLPLMNDASINLVYIFGGGILIEYVFKWPGIGYVLFESMKVLNYPIISAAIFVLACVLVVSMIIADVVSAYLDPRIGVVQ